MATENQYNFFKYVYEKEQDRYKELLNRGKVFIGIISFYVGTLVVNSVNNLPDLKGEHHLWSDYLILVSLITFGIGFFLSILAMGFYKHENITNLTRVIKSFGDSPMRDEDFFDYRLADFTVATERNHEKNNIRAKLLTGTLVCIFLGILSHLIFMFNQ